MRQFNSHPASSRDLPPHTATVNTFKLGHYPDLGLAVRISKWQDGNAWVRVTNCGQHDITGASNQLMTNTHVGSEKPGPIIYSRVHVGHLPLVSSR
jgi:hypothetical protein